MSYYFEQGWSKYECWKKDPRNDPNGHSHYCEKCDNYWECPQLWHCKRDEKTLFTQHPTLIKIMKKTL